VTQQTVVDGEVVPEGVHTPDLYRRNIPVYGGLSDPRLGTISKFRVCPTCDAMYTGGGVAVDDCPGHFGHINLNKPLYHVGFLNYVMKVLKCVCYHCSRLKIKPSHPKYRRISRIQDPYQRLVAFEKACKDMEECKCENKKDDRDGKDGEEEEEEEYKNDNFWKNVASTSTHPTLKTDMVTNEEACGGIQPKYKLEGMTIKAIFPNDMQDIPETGEREQVLTPGKAQLILRDMSDAAIELLGFNLENSRPEWMILTVLPVPPHHVRPSVAFGGMRAEDDITYALMNVVKANIAMEMSVNRCFLFKLLLLFLFKFTLFFLIEEIHIMSN